MSKLEAQNGGGSMVWVSCKRPTISLGLAEILKKEVSVHTGSEPPQDAARISMVVYCASDGEDLAWGVKRLQSLAPEAPVVVFGASEGDLSVARTALRAGARGFIHAGMPPSQIVRAVSVVSDGEIAVPRELLGDLIAGEAPVDTATLSPRQSEILDLVCEGLTNAEVAKRLYLSEFTIKQHLRAAYKLLGVRNRTEAARLLRGGA